MAHLKKICVLLSLALLLLCGGCGTQPQTVRKDLFAMDTLMFFQVYSEDPAVCDGCIEIIQSLEAELSATDPASALSAINADGSGPLSDRAAVLLERTLEISGETNGALDPTVYPLSQLWGFPTKDYRQPTEAEINAALTHVGWQNISCQNGTVRLTNGAQLDLGAVVKGYAGQLCADYLLQQGVAGSINLGGNAQTVGDKPDGTPWQIGIADPDHTAAPIAVLQLQGTNAIVTSGDYQRCFEQDGIRFHHIMDPATGRPADTQLRSVTVVCQDGLRADALSTALFVMGMEEAADFWRQTRDFEAVFINTDREIFVTAGLAEQLTNCEFTVIE